jgi:hypothetical protein
MPVKRKGDTLQALLTWEMDYYPFDCKGMSNNLQQTLV